jgi:hypothetical protein
MSAPKNILVGDRVRFEGRRGMGTIRGEIVAIVPAPAAAGRWIYIRHFSEQSKLIRLAEKALDAMKFVVTFRDVDVQVARGEKVVA